MPSNNEKEILDFLSELLAQDQLKEILEKVVGRAPQIINCEGCSIYLIPELVKQYEGEVIDHNNNRIHGQDLSDSFIVLAAHSHAGKAYYKIGMHFYRSGEGLTGWAFKNEKPLYLDDVSDPKQISMYDGLKWENKYGHADHWYSKQGSAHQKPFIALPLISRKRCVGVIRFTNTKDGSDFTKLAKATVGSFGDLIAKRIETELSIRDKQRSIKNLFSIGAMTDESGVFKVIVEEAQKAVGALASRLYLLDEFGELVELKEPTEEFKTDGIKRHFKRGEGYIGWIFKYGSPLLVNQITPELRLDSSNIGVHTGKGDFFKPFGNNVQTLSISPAPGELGRGNETYTRFLGVPVSKGKGRMHGVLAVLSHSDTKPFNDEDLYLLENFGQTVSLLMENLRQQKLNEMLIHMGHKQGDALLQYTVEHLPPLVKARGCSIFQKSNVNDLFGLTYTSSKWLKNDQNQVLDIPYKPGEGKTGFVAECGRLLVINHYGMGDKDDPSIDHKRLENDFWHYTNDPDYKDFNIAHKVVNSKGEPQGLARLVRDKNDPPFTFKERETFFGFIEKNPYISSEGLECHEAKKIC
ncbi:MAG: GAF domain-containing protein, partial [Desulfobacteraceae bacterium]|nr:GAF domain-containing protein [Desulfobacteraceae bacterium]